MNSLAITLSTKLAFIGTIFNRFQEGGPLGMTLVLVCLLLSILAISLAARNLNRNSEAYNKYKSLANQAALLGLVIGLFNAILGLVGIFDAVEAMGDASPSLVAGGLKVALLSPLFGFLTFILGRTGTFVLGWMSRNP